MEVTLYTRTLIRLLATSDSEVKLGAVVPSLPGEIHVLGQNGKGRRTFVRTYCVPGPC